MAESLSDFSDQAALDGLWQNFFDIFWGSRHHWKQAIFEENESQRRWCTPIPLEFIFNAAICTRPPEGDESARIRDTQRFFQSKGMQEFAWWFAPGVEAKEWGPQLEACGFSWVEGEPGMAANLSRLPESIPTPAGLEINRVEDAQGVKTWTRTFVEGYGLPPTWEPAVLEMALATLHGPWVNYLATVDGQPAAVSSVYLHAGVAGIYNVATLKAQRGQGLGAAVTLHALLAARARGYHIGSLQSSQMGYKVYQRLGFNEVCRMSRYVWQAGQ